MTPDASSQDYLEHDRLNSHHTNNFNEVQYSGSGDPAQNQCDLDLASRFNRTEALKVANSLPESFKYAWAGIAYSFITQRNFRIQTIVGSLALGLSIYLRLSAVECAVIVLTIGAVMAMELLNTALESVVDLTVGQIYHPLAKIAKDCAAGAVMVFAIASLTIAVSLLFPRLLGELQIK